MHIDIAHCFKTAMRLTCSDYSWYAFLF